MSAEKAYLHTNFDNLTKLKISALSGKGSENNKLILRHIAVKGPLLKYALFKNLKSKGLSRYSTVSRRVDNLSKRGYLAKAGEKATERGKQTEESTYGLTWRGLIASLSIKEAREKMLQVLKENPLLVVPEKKLILAVLEDRLDPRNLERIATSLFYDFIKHVPSIEDIEEEDIKTMLLFSALRNASIILREVSQKPDLLTLLDNPTIFQRVKEIIPSIRANLEMQLRNLSYSIRILDEISSLRPEESPSEKLKEFLNTLSANRS